MKHVQAGHTPCRLDAVLVIDDHPMFGDALASAIRHAFTDCEIRTATTLGDGLKVLGSGFTPDLVMLDLKLPDVTGISGFLRLRDRIPDTPILVISALSSTEVVQRVMDAGAAGFVPKDASARFLQEALCEVRAGNLYVPREYRGTFRPTRGNTEICEISRKVADLTPQQTRIMKLICTGKPNKQIAYELSLAEATVKAHITALLRRLGVQNRTQAAVLVESASLENAAQTGEADTRAFLSS